MVSKKKKKVFTEIETDFSAEIGNSNVFSAQKQVVSKKKKRSSPKLRLIFRPKSEIKRFFSPKAGGLQNKKRSSPKLRLNFWPKSEIQMLFHTASRDLLHNFGTQFPLGRAVFNFSPKIGLKSTKNVQFCVLHKPMGGSSSPPAPPPPPPGYATGCSKREQKTTMEKTRINNGRERILKLNANKQELLNWSQSYFTVKTINLKI